MAENGLQNRERHKPVTVLFGYDEEISKWVGRELCETFTDCRALGYICGGEIIGGVVFHSYRAPSIEMSIATLDPRWCNKSTLFASFHYPFIQLGVKRITVMTDAENHPVREFLKRIGFVFEATLKDALHDGDAAIYRMLPDECKWIKRNTNGKIITKSAKSA